MLQLQDAAPGFPQMLLVFVGDFCELRALLEVQPVEDRHEQALKHRERVCWGFIAVFETHHEMKSETERHSRLTQRASPEEAALIPGCCCSPFCGLLTLFLRCFTPLTCMIAELSSKDASLEDNAEERRSHSASVNFEQLSLV